MRKMLLFIIGLIAVLPLKAELPISEIGVAYYDDFTVDPYVPYSEDNIIWEDEMCKYGIRKDDFLCILSEVGDGSTYNRDHVKAKVIFSESGVYFIDKKGTVRHENNAFYSIDKDGFELMIYPVGPRCPPGDVHQTLSNWKRRLQIVQYRARQNAKEREWTAKCLPSSKGTKYDFSPKK